VLLSTAVDFLGKNEVYVCNWFCLHCTSQHV